MAFHRTRYSRTSVILALLMLALYGAMMLLQTPCVFKFFFRIPCPGCGMRDALWALMRLDFAGAFSCHPMVWSLPLLPVLVLTDGRPTKSRAVNRLILGIVLGGFLISYIYRLTVYFGPQASAAVTFGPCKNI